MCSSLFYVLYSVGYFNMTYQQVRISSMPQSCYFDTTENTQKRGNAMSQIRQLLGLLIAALLLISCGQPATPADETPVAPSESSPLPADEGYPAPADEGYPAPQTNNGYPEPRSDIPEGPEFSMVEPVRASDTLVTGTGAPGVPIKLVDVTQSGLTLAETTINDDGSYTFDVAGKLVPQNRISLILGDTEGTSFNRDEFLRGPGYQDNPFIGVMFATTIITE